MSSPDRGDSARTYPRAGGQWERRCSCSVELRNTISDPHQSAQARICPGCQEPSNGVYQRVRSQLSLFALRALAASQSLASALWLVKSITIVISNASSLPLNCVAETSPGHTSRRRGPHDPLATDQRPCRIRVTCRVGGEAPVPALSAGGFLVAATPNLTCGSSPHPALHEHVGWFFHASACWTRSITSCSG
jgi:hypothetical protein